MSHPHHDGRHVHHLDHPANDHLFLILLSSNSAWALLMALLSSASSSLKKMKKSHYLFILLSSISSSLHKSWIFLQNAQLPNHVDNSSPNFHYQLSTNITINTPIILIPHLIELRELPWSFSFASLRLLFLSICWYLLLKTIILSSTFIFMPDIIVMLRSILRFHRHQQCNHQINHWYPALIFFISWLPSWWPSGSSWCLLTSLTLMIAIMTPQKMANIWP